jgi:threonine dehydrogenase-like Zn-dependent dehydrogenase
VHGGYAEYTVSVADHTYLLPGGLDDAQAATARPMPDQRTGRQHPQERLRQLLVAVRRP